MSKLPQHRSLLFSPAIRPDLMEKAENSGADAVIFDLEDSVAQNAKEIARANVQKALSEPRSRPAYVRISHPDTGDTEADLNALATSGAIGLEGVFFPKVEYASQITKLDNQLAQVESKLGIDIGTLTIVPMIETCLGVIRSSEILTASKRIRGIAIASAEEGDLMLDLGGYWTPNGEAMNYARGRLICEAKAVGVHWLIDGVFMNLNDELALRHECQLARNMGYVGKLAIHPKQLSIFHETFSPSMEEIEYAHTLIAAFREAEKSGKGAISFKGMMVDYANVKRAQRILQRARRTQI